MPETSSKRILEEAMETQPSVTALRRWLYTAAILRFFSVYLGFFDYSKFQANLFSKQPEAVTELYGRTFACWTATNCVLCLICARDPRQPEVYGATLFSFVVALLHFITELLIFKTMSVASAVTPMLVAGVSVLWMGLGWSYYTNYARRPSASQILLSSEEKSD